MHHDGLSHAALTKAQADVLRHARDVGGAYKGLYGSARGGGTRRALVKRLAAAGLLSAGEWTITPAGLEALKEDERRKRKNASADPNGTNLETGTDK